MSDPTGQQLIGASTGAITLDGGRSEVAVPLDTAAVQRLLSSPRTAAPLAPASTASVAAQAWPGRVYLCLDGIRGTLDASVLSVHLRWSGAGAAGGAAGSVAAREPFHAGSVGLYGLRRASAPHAAGAGRGLGYVLDVTAFFAAAFATPLSDAPSAAEIASHGALLVCLDARVAPPASASIVVGQLRVLAALPG